MSISQVKWKAATSAPGAGSWPDRVKRLTMRERIASFADDVTGDVAIIFGLMAMAMFFLIGAAVDLGRWLNARDQTVSAIDSAVLAAGRTLQTSQSNHTDAIAMAVRYYQEATKNRLTVINDNVSFAIVDGGTAVMASGNAEIKTPFMSLAGIKTLPLLKNSGAEHAKAVLAVGGNAELNLEISMMLDTSGSMGEGSKLRDMKDAAKDLVDIVVWQDQSKYKSRIAVVPFSGDVRVPSAWLGQATDPTWPATRLLSWGWGSLTYKKTACVAERSGSNKHTDAAPGPSKYVMSAYTSNGKCSQTSTDNELLPLTANKDTIKNKIETLDLGGGTAGHIGTAWAYYMLSPNWASLMNADNKPVAYGTPKTEKIAILMTDGEYNYTYDNLGIPTSANGSNGSANGNSSAGQAIALCNQMKGSGIDVYTVGFDLGGNQTAINTLKNCASDASKAYNADNAEQLKAAFRDIALKVSTLYLSK